MPQQHNMKKSKGLKKPSIAQVLLLLLVVAIYLRIFGFRRAYIRLGHMASFFPVAPVSPESTPEKARKIAQRIIFVNRNFSFYQTACLSESLTLWFLLRRYGISADFRLGVRTITGRFESHAWVEYDGIVLNDLETANRIYGSFDLNIIPPASRSS